MALTQVDPALSKDPSKDVLTLGDAAPPVQLGRLTVDLTKLEGVESAEVIVLERLGNQAVTQGHSLARREERSEPVARVRELSPQARSLVEVAAMMAGSFSVSEVADILGQPAGHLLQAVEEAIREGILTPDRGRFEFADEEFRRGVYEGLAEPLRVGLHGHIGRQLLDRGGSPAVAAVHLILGTRPGDHQALAYLDRATEELMPRFAQAAADLALGALALTDGADSHRWTRRISTVDALVAAERPEEALELARRGIADGQVPGLAAAELRLRVASNLLAHGLGAESVEELAIVIRTGGLPDTIYGAAELQIQLGLLAQESFGDARERALSVLAGSGRSNGDVALAGALTTLAVLDWNEGRPAHAIDMARAAAERAGRDPESPCTTIPQLLLASMLTAIGEHEEADALLKTATAALEVRGRGLWLAGASVLRSQLLLASGAAEAARAGAEEGMALAEELRTTLFAPAARSVLAAVALHQGNHHGAADQVQPAGGSGSYHRSVFGLRLGVLPALQVKEATEGCAAVVAEMAAMEDVTSWKRLQLEDPTAAAWAVRAALDAGERPVAERSARCADELAADNPELPSLVAAADHARGLLTGDVDVLLSAATAHRRPWARARATEDAGVMVSNRNDPAAAHLHLDRALNAYQELGAEHDVARVRSLLRTMGVRHCHWRRRERPVSGWDSLTETERAVSDLVAQGLTNRKAAEQMFLSPHTIDFHLRQIFRKLQIDSRVDLTRLAIERDAASGS
jgi:DNA-binding CsgD family transcriptional regulator/tetratricopeptide (TPR) repeat protein